MKIIDGRNYGGVQHILVEDDDNRTMDEIRSSIDPILDIIENYVDLVEASQ